MKIKPRMAGIFGPKREREREREKERERERERERVCRFIDLFILGKFISSPRGLYRRSRRSG